MFLRLTVGWKRSLKYEVDMRLFQVVHVNKTLQEDSSHLRTFEGITCYKYKILVPILTRTRNDAPRCIQVLFMKCKTYDLRGLIFLHIDVSVHWCILRHVEIPHKQGWKSSSFVIHIKPPFFLTSKRSFTKIDPRLA